MLCDTAKLSQKPNPSPPLAPCSNNMQIDIASLTVPVHDPTDADYILTSVLLASSLGGSFAGIQAWSGGFKEGVPHHSRVYHNLVIIS